MSNFVITVLLVAALLHAGWNGLVKTVRLEPVAKAALLNSSAGLCGVPLAVYFGPPSEPAYPYLLASAVFNNLYIFSLMYAYRYGRMDQIYPLVRGVAVFLTAVIGALLLGEELRLMGWLGVSACAIGILLLAAPGRNNEPFNALAVGFAALTALFLSGALIVDGLGARISNNVYGYIGWMFMLMGGSTLSAAGLLSGTRIFRETTREWKRGLAGGLMMFFVYGIGIWAMTLELIPKVVAVRDASVLFGTAIAYLVLKEPIDRIRVLGAVTVVVALLLVRVG